MREYLSIISGFLLPALQLLIIQRYITTLFGSGSRKLAGMIGWLLYYAFLVMAGFGILFASAVSVGREYPDGIYDQYRYKKRESEKTLYQHPSYLYGMDAGRSHCVAGLRGSWHRQMRH